MHHFILYQKSCTSNLPNQIYHASRGMAVKSPSEHWYSKMIKKIQIQKRVILPTLQAIFVGIHMLGRLTFNSANSWLRNKRSKAITYAMVTLHRNEKPFHDRLNILENTSTVLTKATFNNLQALKTRRNLYNEGLDILNRNFQNFLRAMNDKFCRMTVTLNNHHFATKMLTKAFTSYTKALRKYIGFYNSYSTGFQDFLSVIDGL